MTEEQQGGTAPDTDANASVDPQAPDQPAAAIAVADEPAQTTDTESGIEADAGTPDVADPPASEATAESVPPVEAEAEAVADAGPAAGPRPDEAPDPGDRPTDDQPQEAPAPAATHEAPEATPPPTSASADEDADGATATADDTADAPAASDEEEPEPEPEPKRDLGPEPTTMEELLAEQDSDIKSFKHGDVVEGNVVRIDKDEILVDIGAKSEGVVSNRELFGRHGGGENQAPLNIGDTVLVYVLQPESPEGHAVLSLRRAGLERKWRAMQEQFEAGVIIEAPVIDHNKGGLIVDCGIRGFVPISQIVDFPRRPQNDQPRDAAQEIAEKLMPFVGRKLRLKILEVNRKANRLILSEKVALYEERREKRDELFSSLQVGQKVTGTVRSIAPFGVFIDLGGIDGLVHKSELSWNKVNNPESGYKVGEEVEAEVIDINHERGRISLSIRRLQPDPWHSTVADFNVGDVIDGTVTKLVNFGAFVRVRDGLEGLIHISELSHQRVAHPGDVVHEGQSLKLKIISLDSERHRLGLSLKQAEEAPARVAVEPGQPAPSGGGGSRPERRPRQERPYSMSDAVQEPEGGIDNTLASAFAQVRQQLAAAGVTDEPSATDAPAEEPTAASDEATAEAAAVDLPGDEAQPAIASDVATPDTLEPEATDEAAPVTEEPTPAAEATDEAAPVIEEPTPAAEATDEAAPVIEEPTPAAEATDEAAPVIEEPTPAAEATDAEAEAPAAEIEAPTPDPEPADETSTPEVEAPGVESAPEEQKAPAADPETSATADAAASDADAGAAEEGDAKA